MPSMYIHVSNCIILHMIILQVSRALSLSGRGHGLWFLGLGQEVCELLVGRLGELCVRPEVRAQITVRVGDGSKGCLS